MSSLGERVEPLRLPRPKGASKDPVKRAKQLANLKRPRRSRAEFAINQKSPGIAEFRKKNDWKQLVAWARANSPEAALNILAMMRNPHTKSNVRFACADWIVSRGFGRAPQLVRVEDDRRALATAPAGLDEAAYVAEVKRILTQAGALDEVPPVSISDEDRQGSSDERDVRAATPCEDEAPAGAASLQREPS